MDSITHQGRAESPTEPASTGLIGDRGTASQATPWVDGCVHFEHAGSVAGNDVGGPANPATAPVAMSSYRLLVCLAILGWSVRDLARRTGRHQTTVVRWAKSLSPVPGKEAAWLETLVAFHVAHPAPRRSSADTPSQTMIDH